MSETKLPLLARAIDSVTIGIVLLNHEQRVVFWNAWMERHSRIPAKNTEGKTLAELFPEMCNGRVQNAITESLRTGLSSLLSQSLNQAPFPLFGSSIGVDHTIRIQQAIQVIPIAVAESSRYCLLQITDVSASVYREKLLRDQALVLHRHSYFDVLTGIANRRRFDEYSEEEFRRARRTASPIALILLDIDHFKKYNDYYGHQAGDQCLKQVAATLAGVLKRPADLLARYGGEEFVAVLPETDSAGAHQVGEVMRERIESIQLPHAASPTAGHITISIGTAARLPGRDDVLALLIRSADQALYHAKHTGRNRVASAEDDGE